MRLQLCMVGSYQPVVVDVSADGLDDLAGEMGRVRWIKVKLAAIDGSDVDYSALIPVHRVQMIVQLE